LLQGGALANHLTPNNKKRQHQRSEPAFTTVRQNRTGDALKGGVLAILRLVAGTSVTGTVGESLDLPAGKGYDAAKRGLPEPEALARATIYTMRLGGEGPTIKELLDKANLDEVSPGNPLADVLNRKERIRAGFHALGMHLHAALPDMELDAKVFGIVLHPKTLLKACPALKPCAPVLEGLTF
jgi:hypothetical protein